MRLEEQGKTGQKLRGIRQKRQKKRADISKNVVNLTEENIRFLCPGLGKIVENAQKGGDMQKVFIKTDSSSRFAKKIAK